MEDPCIRCDKLDQHYSFLEQNCPQAADLEKQGSPSLLRETLQQYQQSPRKYKHLIENSPDAIFLADTETGVILETNNKAAELLGIPLDQIIGMHQSKIHPPEEAKKYAQIFRGYAQMELGFACITEDVVICNASGEKIPVQINASVTQIGSQKVIYGIFRDMTEQKRNQQELKAVFESSQDCILVWDKDYNYLHANQAAIEHVKTTRDKVIGKNIRDGLGHIPDFMHLWMGRIDEVFKAGEPMCVTDAVPINDRIVYSESVLSPIRYPNGEMFAVGVVYRDVTEQKRNKEQLKVSEERFKCLSEAAFEGVIFHENGIFTESNQQFADMFGYSLDEIGGLDGSGLFVPESREFVREKITSGDEGPYEATCLRKDGSTFPVEVRAKAVQLKGRNTRVAVVRDLTEQKKIQQQLADSEQKYKNLYHNAKAALFRTRISDGIMLDCSRVTIELLGYTTKEEYQNHFSVTETYADPQRREQFIEALRKDKYVQGFHAQLERKDGTPFWVSLSAEIFPEYDYIEGMMVDITATKILTKTEMNILREILTGKSNKRIAYSLKRSVRTVEDHRAHIMHKFGVDNIVDLTRKAMQYGITPNGK